MRAYARALASSLAFSADATRLTGVFPNLRDVVGRGEKLRHVHAGFHAHAFQHVDDIFRRNIARRARRIGTPPRPPAAESITRAPSSRPAYRLASA
jgi:hypothetical protein